MYVKANKNESPNPQLKAFTKVLLHPGEEKQVQLHLPMEAFSLFNENGEQKVETGNYTIYVGGSQPDTRSIQLTGNRPLEMELKANQTIEIDK